jgi:hypothetical protein
LHPADRNRTKYWLWRGVQGIGLMRFFRLTLPPIGFPNERYTYHLFPSRWVEFQPLEADRLGERIADSDRHSNG